MSRLPHRSLRILRLDQTPIFREDEALVPQEPFKLHFDSATQLHVLTETASQAQRSLPNTADDWVLQQDVRDASPQSLAFRTYRLRLRH